MEDREAIIKKLDKEIEDIMEKYWKEYPNLVGVGYSGCIKYGTLIIRRNEHPDGLTFKVSDKQMNELINDGKTVVFDKDMIQQIHYDEQ